MIKIVQYFMLFVCSVSIAQEKFEISYKETAVGYEIIANNGEFAPVSVEINFEIANLSSSVGNTTIVVVPPLTKEHPIANLKVIDVTKAFELGYNLRYNHGNYEQREYDEEYPYYLPYKKGTEQTVSQGYDGMMSHQGEYALDFRMPEDTDVYAAREGVVVLVEESFQRTCTDSDCAKYNNYIVVYHSDGTFAEYTHIKKDGSLVNPGDKIKKGQHIAQSGNVGWTTGPHLHFIVFFQRFNSRETLPTKFLVNKGKESKSLEVGMTYRRDYK